MFGKPTIANRMLCRIVLNKLALPMMAIDLGILASQPLQTCKKNHIPSQQIPHP